ncbi:hypothetical protein RND71_011364 [Anisodus tanguticus]|uniref:Protein kinase domain-containing protein n=1 Tax=Anisodus tanguticus TaxID=243964 RepID=A0AAE1SDD6_9SOLA|nr:hypothetical protein RND71_011364 [Anisodus tanguticus]
MGCDSSKQATSHSPAHDSSVTVVDNIDPLLRIKAGFAPLEKIKEEPEKEGEDSVRRFSGFFIGQGTYSSVYRARDIENGKMVALKKVRFDNFQPDSVRFMAREIAILRKLDHPNIMNLEGIITSRLSCSIYLVFEYMEHDLSGLLSCPDIKFTDSQIKCYMQQLLSGLEHCHSRGIMHRDIKVSNILVDNEGILKIADFGLANFLSSRHKKPLTSRVVTLWYRPPELLLGSTSYGVEQLHKIFKLCGSPPDDYWKRSKLPLATMFKPKQPYDNPHKRGTDSSALNSEVSLTKTAVSFAFSERDPVPQCKHRKLQEIHEKPGKLFKNQAISAKWFPQRKTSYRLTDINASGILHAGDTFDSNMQDNDDFLRRTTLSSIILSIGNMVIMNAQIHLTRLIKNYQRIMMANKEGLGSRGPCYVSPRSLTPSRIVKLEKLVVGPGSMEIGMAKGEYILHPMHALTINVLTHLQDAGEEIMHKNASSHHRNQMG